MFNYKFGPINVGVEFGSEISLPLQEELVSNYAHVTTNANYSELDHYCRITSWNVNSYKSVPEDLVKWNNRHVSIRTKRNIRLEAEYNQDFDTSIAVFEGIDYMFNNDRKRYWEFVQRVSLYPKLINDNLYLIHCAAIIIDGKAHIFLGPSGAGKTTTALKARKAGYEILSDDTCILSWKGDRVTAFAAPYKSKSGIIGVNGEYEVASFYILNQDIDTSVETITLKQFAKSLQERLYEAQYWAHIFEMSFSSISTEVAKKILKFTLFLSRRYKPLQYNNSKESNIKNLIGVKGGI